jgi:hypothetical protein
MAEEMVIILPIVGWAVATHPSGTGLLVIRHVPGIPPSGTTQEEIDKETVALQYGIGAEQCIEFGQALIDLGERLRLAKSSLN